MPNKSIKKNCLIFAIMFLFAIMILLLFIPITYQSYLNNIDKLTINIEKMGITNSPTEPTDTHTYIGHVTWEIDSSQEVFSAITEEIANCRYHRTWDTFFGDGEMEVGDLLLNVYGEGIPGIMTLTAAGFIRTDGRIYALYGGGKAGRELIEEVYRLLLESGIEPVSIAE